MSDTIDLTHSALHISNGVLLLQDALSNRRIPMQEATKLAQETSAEERRLAEIAAEEAAGKAASEHEALSGLLAESEAKCADLEAKVARAAASLKAADELRDLK